jgi:transposase-like protein
MMSERALSVDHSTVHRSTKRTLKIRTERTLKMLQRTCGILGNKTEPLRMRALF